MDIFSPVVGLATSLILLPGPILPDVSDVFSASSPAAEQRVYEASPMPSIEALLATRSGFRALGYGGLTFTLTKSTAGN